MGGVIDWELYNFVMKILASHSWQNGPDIDLISLWRLFERMFRGKQTLEHVVQINSAKLAKPNHESAMNQITLNSPWHVFGTIKAGLN
jgi:hypothetical protein